ncbi:PilZ domain-containing protein [bacterium]|jgi:hypothetical protein|nr:PilZ domain-containing protein [bacterium]
MNSPAKTILTPSRVPVRIKEELAELTALSEFDSRRIPRIDVQYTLPSVKMIRTDRPTEAYNIVTVSENGASFLTGNERMDLSQVHPTAFILGENQLQVSSKVVYCKQEQVGVQFQDPTNTLHSLIRKHFFLEFIASSLRPSVHTSYFGEEWVRNLSYGEKNSYGVEIFQQKDGRLSLEVRLGHLNAVVRWKTGHAIRVTYTDSQQVPEDDLRRQLISFFHNLRGLRASSRHALDMVFLTEEITIQHIA